jgi:molybdate transport repressor ModE-like protein
VKFGSVGATIAADSTKNAEPLLKVGNIPIIRRIILTLQQAGVFPIVIVTKPEEEEIIHQVAQLGVVFIQDEDAENSQMFTSVKRGLSYLQGKCDRVVFTPVNTPMFSAQTLLTLLKSSAQIVKPTYQGRGGHPLILDSSVIEQILAYDGPDGLRGAIKACKGQNEAIEVQDAGVLVNIHNATELQQHLEEHNASLLSPTVKISINKETEFFNSRLKLLLFLIADLHSVRQACLHMGLSYQKAWNLINNFEEETQYPIITRQRGGINGGEAYLTEKGQKLMYAFQRYEEEMNTFAQQRFEVLFKESELI